MASSQKTREEHEEEFNQLSNKSWQRQYGMSLKDYIKGIPWSAMTSKELKREVQARKGKTNAKAAEMASWLYNQGKDTEAVVADEVVANQGMEEEAAKDGRRGKTRERKEKEQKAKEKEDKEKRKREKEAKEKRAEEKRKEKKRKEKKNKEKGKSAIRRSEDIEMGGTNDTEEDPDGDSGSGSDEDLESVSSSEADSESSSGSESVSDSDSDSESEDEPWPTKSTKLSAGSMQARKSLFAPVLTGHKETDERAVMSAKIGTSFQKPEYLKEKDIEVRWSCTVQHANQFIVGFGPKKSQLFAYIPESEIRTVTSKDVTKVPRISPRLRTFIPQKHDKGNLGNTEGVLVAGADPSKLFTFEWLSLFNPVNILVKRLLKMNAVRYNISAIIHVNVDGKAPVPEPLPLSDLRSAWSGLNAELKVWQLACHTFDRFHLHYTKKDMKTSKKALKLTVSAIKTQATALVKEYEAQHYHNLPSDLLAMLGKANARHRDKWGTSDHFLRNDPWAQVKEEAEPMVKVEEVEDDVKAVKSKKKKQRKRD